MKLSDVSKPLIFLMNQSKPSNEFSLEENGANNNPDRPACVIWLTGIPAAGKTTLGQATARALRKTGSQVRVIDGDELRRTLSRDLGFSIQDREEQSRRVIELCSEYCRDGITVVVCLVSPTRSIRESARARINKFLEVWVKCSVDECIKRDPKGLYKRALRGDITNLTGLQEIYEEPTSPDVLVDTEVVRVDEGVELILRILADNRYF